MPIIDVGEMTQPRLVGVLAIALAERFGVLRVVPGERVAKVTLVASDEAVEMLRDSGVDEGDLRSSDAIELLVRELLDALQERHSLDEETVIHLLKCERVMTMDLGIISAPER